MRNKFFGLALAWALLLPQAHGAYGIVTNLFNATENMVTNAYQTLPDNSLIIIHPTAFTFGTAVSQSRAVSVSVRGVSTNGVFLTMAPAAYAWNISNSSTNKITIADMTLIGDPNNSAAILSIGHNQDVAPGFAAPFEFARLNVTNYHHGLRMGDGDARGVAHHTRVVTAAGTVANWNNYIFGGNGWVGWQNPNPLGTTSVVAVEDSVSDNQTAGNLGNGHFDGYNGPQVLFRKSLFKGDAYTGVHGYDSQATGARTLELFDNVFTNVTSSGTLAETRGGTFMAFNNKVYGTVGLNPFILNYYRACWGSYQGALGFMGYDKTNQYDGAVLSATSTTLTVTNVPFSDRQYVWYSGQFYSNTVNHTTSGNLITITGGTGAGQSRLITASTLGSQTAASQVVFTVDAAWGTVPDATSTFEIGYAEGASEQIGNQPPYRFTSGSLTLDRQVKIGTNLTETLYNLMLCVNKDPTGSGTRYYANSTRQTDFTAVSQNATNIVYHNFLDGTGTLGYPGAFQEGVLGPNVKYTNTTVLFPCMTGNNTVNGTNGAGFSLRWDTNSPCAEFNTNAVLAGRDFYDTNTLPYTQLTYPHPWIGSDPPVALTSVPAGVTLTNTMDLSGVVSVVTPMTNAYIVGEMVTFSAPATYTNLTGTIYTFANWTRDGTLFDTNATTSTTIDQTRAFAANYQQAGGASGTIKKGKSRGKRR